MMAYRRILLDTDVVLDHLLDRSPWAEAANRLWNAHSQGVISIYISAITPLNVFYIVRRLLDIETARTVVGTLLDTFPICRIDEDILQRAFHSEFQDFEDGVQHACALAFGLEAIVSRNLRDYTAAQLPVYDPVTFTKLLSSN